MNAATAAASVRLLDSGDCAVTVEFGDSVSQETAARVAGYDRALAAALAGSVPSTLSADTAHATLSAIVETMPTFRSLTVFYDPLRTRRAELDPILLALAQGLSAAPASGARRWSLPVCYGGEYGADLDAVARAKGLAPAAVVELHAATEFKVYMIAFMPGMPFLGDLPAALSMPRLREPRLKVPAGSVGITGSLSNVYPWESPGGWLLIGRCPITLFDARAAQPSLLAPGDTVRFEAVSPARYAEIDAAIRAGELAPAACSEPAA